MAEHKPSLANPQNSGGVPPDSGNSPPLHDSLPWQRSSAAVQSEQPETGSSALHPSRHATSPADEAGAQHLSRALAPEPAGPSTLAPDGNAACLAACSESVSVGQSRAFGREGPKLSAQHARPAPLPASALFVDLTSCDSHQPVHQHTGTLQSGPNLLRGGALICQRAESTAGRQLQGHEQQCASSTGVRLSAVLPCQASAQRDREEHQPAFSRRLSSIATLPHQGTADPGQTGARPQTTPAQTTLLQQAAAERVQQGSKPQSASAPGLAPASRGTGVFSSAQGDDSDDDDFMPSKLLADISKAASAPSVRTLHHSNESAACPQGCVITHLQ